MRGIVPAALARGWRGFGRIAALGPLRHDFTEAPPAAAVELHGTAVGAGVMKMRRVGAVALPAGQAVKLAPGGLHLMLVDLRRPLEPGDRVTLTLTVERAGSAGRDVVTLEAEVRAPAAAP